MFRLLDAGFARSLPALIGVLSLAALPLAAQTPPTGEPCKMLLAKGFKEVHRAQFQTAVEDFMAARNENPCAVEANLGLAEAFNSLNRHGDAIAAAELALASTEDPELLALGHFQIGIANDRRGRRLNRKKQKAMDAFRQAVELSAGEHEQSVRGLMRIFDETGQYDELRALQERFPKIRMMSRAEQVTTIKRSISMSGQASRPGAAEQLEINSGQSFDCTSKKVVDAVDWDRDLPRFSLENERRVAGFESPERLEMPPPSYSDESRKARVQGTVEWELQVDAKGTPRFARVLVELHPHLDASSLLAICASRWQAATTLDGEPTAFYSRGVTNFRLQ